MPLFGPNIRKLKERGDVKSLINLLAHDKPSIRLETVRALFDLKDFEGLAEALKNDLSSVRTEAVSMLGNIDLPETIRLLSQFILHEAKESVWQQAFDILTTRIIDVDTWISIGLKLLKEGQIERGIKCFDRAVKLNPDRKQIGAAAGALLEIGRPKESLIYFDKYIALAGDDDQGWAGKGWCLAQIGQMNEALECANKAMSINPTNAWTRDLAAMIYLDKKEYERVCSIEMETLQYHPDYIRAYVTWSEAFSLLGKLNDAVETLQRAIEVLHQQDWVKSEDAQNVHLQLGLIYAMKGERELALSHFREGRAALADDRGRAMEEGYEILTILGLCLEGTPKVRYARLIAISEIRQSKGYKDLAEKIIAEGSVADCIDYDWLSENPVDTVTALLKWWSPAKIEQLAHALTRADMQMLTETADKAMAEFIHKR